MSGEIDELSVAMPILILPVERNFKSVMKALGLILAIAFSLAIFTSIAIKFYQGTITESAVPAKESQMGSLAGILNLMYLLVLVVIVTFAMIWIIKKGKIGLFRIIMTILIIYLIVVFTPFIISLYTILIMYSLYNLWGFLLPEIFLVVLVYTLAYGTTILFVVVYLLSVIRRKYFYARNIVLILIGVWTAVWLSWNFGEITPIIVLLGFAIYDLYSVFKGPLRELSEVLVEREKSMFEGSDRGIMLGLGDIFFYSFAIGYSFAFLSIPEILIIIAVMFLGVLLTIFILFHFEVNALPALPLPIIAAVALIIIFKYLV